MSQESLPTTSRTETPTEDSTSSSQEGCSLRDQEKQSTENILSEKESLTRKLVDEGKKIKDGTVEIEMSHIQPEYISETKIPLWKDEKDKRKILLIRYGFCGLIGAITLLFVGVFIVIGISL
ncbi:hypothetical protein EDI_025850 [Entamoeba dispar SAW760]|uniref:Uncharacterized protein n=1 Tax=Entamoeba dispar (strain ATCC PRA-260 / SAW760) TaxID=370354 RepID=B0EBK7_ENTDS|nr:uncharacterized protein EDI_025850 [Entamoeba dispar SAW760]EDR28114.1 hypothetical protein EDI_025850 [Entamoeba dispar SAW760]|eukprot:EDR28114.1 hypothetical protein EDI_025850 [Entamoeba dispar SAW760]